MERTFWSDERLDKGFADLRSEMRAEFADVRAEMRAEFADVRQEMRDGFREVRGQLAQLKLAMLASNTAIVAALIALHG